MSKTICEYIEHGSPILLYAGNKHYLLGDNKGIWQVATRGRKVRREYINYRRIKQDYKEVYNSNNNKYYYWKGYFTAKYTGKHTLTYQPSPYWWTPAGHTTGSGSHYEYFYPVTFTVYLEAGKKYYWENDKQKVKDSAFIFDGKRHILKLKCTDPKNRPELNDLPEYTIFASIDGYINTENGRFYDTLEERGIIID